MKTVLPQSGGGGLAALYGTAFAAGFSLGAFNPLMAIVMESAGRSPRAIGLQSVAYFAALACSAPLVAGFTRRHGPRLIICGGLVCAGAVAPLFPLAGGEAGWTGVRLLLGVAVACFMVGGQTLLNALAGDDRRAGVMAAHATAFGAGFGLGPVAGTHLYMLSPAAGFLAGTVVLWAAAAVAWPALRGSQVRAQSAKITGVLRTLSLPLHGAFLYGAYEAVMIALFPAVLLARGFTTAQAGYAVTAFVIGGGLGMIPAARLGDAWGRERALGLLAALGLVAALVAGQAKGMGFLLAACAAMGAGIGPVFPLSLALVGERIPAAGLAAGSAWFTAAFSWGCVVGPLAATAAPPGRSGGLFLALEALILWFIARVVIRWWKGDLLPEFAHGQLLKELLKEDRQMGTIRISRRGFLKFGGAAAGVAAVGLTGLKIASEPDYAAPAYRVWAQRRKGTLSDAEYIAMCGMLAANPHNTQPWKFRLGGQIELLEDHLRTLGKADPAGRMRAMGIGCALENMRVAATTLGYLPAIKFGAGGVPSLDLSRRGSAGEDPWFDAIFRRQTTRAAFAKEEVPAAFRGRLERLADLPGIGICWFRGQESLNHLAELNVEGAKAWVADDARHRDGIKWWRYSREEWETKKDGLSIYTSAAPFFIKEGMAVAVTPAMMAESFGKQGEIDWAAGLSPHTPLWGLVHSRTDDRRAWIDAGRCVERIYLQATVEGFRICPMAYLTELEEMKNRLKRVAGLSGKAEPLFLFRVGRAPALEKSVRRNLRDVLV